MTCDSCGKPTRPHAAWGTPDLDCDGTCFECIHNADLAAEEQDSDERPKVVITGNSEQLLAALKAVTARLEEVEKRLADMSQPVAYTAVYPTTWTIGTGRTFTPSGWQRLALLSKAAA